MSRAVVEPGPRAGTIRAIASKSDAHRNLICAALSEDPTEFAPFARSEDIEATLACLQAFGVVITQTPAGGCRVSPGPANLCPQLDCGESGSTLRFLLPLGAAYGNVGFTGRGRLPQRRIEPLLQALEARGCTFSARQLPLTVSGFLTPGVFEIVGNESSQYISGLLFVLPLLPGDSEIRLTTPLSSRGYVDMTLRTLARFGIRVEETPEGWRVPGGQRYRSPGRAVLEGDWSNAAFHLVSGALGGAVTVTGLDSGSAQRDREIAELLARFGARITVRGDAVTAAPGTLTGQRVDVDQIPDLLPVLAVLGCAARGETVLCNAARLRDKESDRLTAAADMLRALGGEVREEPDALVIRGTGSLRGGCVDGAGDHRIVMAAATAAVICREPVEIRGAEAAAKSYPAFLEDCKALGGKIHVI